MAISGVESEMQQQAIRCGNPIVYNLPQPASHTGTAVTYLAADVIGGIIVHAPTAAGAGTLPSAALMIPAIPGEGGKRPVVGDSVFCLITNPSTFALTINFGSGGAFDGNQPSASIAAGTSKEICLRVTNPNPGSEAYVVYV
jgi:hypothetical protein